MDLSVAARTPSSAQTDVQSVPAKAAAVSQPLSETQQRQIQQARDAVRLKIDMAAQRKASARKSLDDIKQVMDKLRLTASVAPKATAQILKGMSKRLADAADTYVAAGDPAEIEALNRQVEGKARVLEGKPALTASYTDPQSDADGKFISDIKALKKQMDGMFNAALSQFGAQDPKGAEKLGAAYDENFKPILQAAQTIVGWHRPDHIAQVFGGHAVNLKA